MFSKRKKQPFLAALIPKPKFNHIHLLVTNMTTLKVPKPFLSPVKPLILIMVFAKHMGILRPPRLSGITRSLGLLPHVFPEPLRCIEFLSL